MKLEPVAELLTTKTKQRQKSLAISLYQQIVTSLSFFLLMANFEESANRKSRRVVRKTYKN